MRKLWHVIFYIDCRYDTFMKKIFLTLFLISLTTILSANKNWIEIEQSNKNPAKKSSAKIDIDVAHMNPMNLVLKNRIAIQKLLDSTNKYEKSSHNKNWILFHNEENK